MFGTSRMGVHRRGSLQQEVMSHDQLPKQCTSPSESVGRWVWLVPLATEVFLPVVSRGQHHAPLCQTLMPWQPLVLREREGWGEEGLWREIELDKI